MADVKDPNGLSDDDIDALLDAAGGGPSAASEDPLLTDFDERVADAGANAPPVAPVAPAAAAQPAVGEEVNEEDLAELDAFLDEFGQQMDADAAAPAEITAEEPDWNDHHASGAEVLEEIPIEAMSEEPPHEEVAKALATLSADELSLADEPPRPPPAANADLTHDRLFDDPGEDTFTPSPRARELAQAAAPAAAPQEAPTVSERAVPFVSDQRIPPAGTPVAAADRRPLLAAAAALGIALIGGGGALWMSTDMSGELARLSAAVEQLRNRAPAVASQRGPEVAAQLDQLAAELARLRQRVDEIGTLLDGPMSHVRESNAAELRSLNTRIEQTEKLVGSLTQSVAALRLPKPTAEKPVPVETVPVAAPTPPTAAAPAVPSPKAPTKAPVASAAVPPAPPAAEVKPAPTAEPAKQAAVTKPESRKPEVKEAKTAEAKKAVARQPAPARKIEPTGGPWVVNLVSLSSESLADDELEAFRRRGIAAQKFTAEVDGRIWHRLRVTGFASREEAGLYARQAKSRLRVAPWLTRDD